MNVVLLPGLDGTGTLFTPFIRNAPEWANPIVISYDQNKKESYDELIGNVLKAIDKDQPYLLIAESFSGPIAISLAANNPVNLKGLVLCASFAVNPMPHMSLLFIPSLFRYIFRKKIPAWAIRRFLTGVKSTPELVKATASAIQSVSPEILVERMKMVIEVDSIKKLEQCHLPMLYISAAQDMLISNQSFTVIQSVKPNIRYVQIEGSHFVMQTKPSEVWHEINKFVG